MTPEQAALKKATEELRNQARATTYLLRGLVVPTFTDALIDLHPIITQLEEKIARYDMALDKLKGSQS